MLVSTGLAGSWAIGLLILVGQASEHVAGPSTIAALVMAALTALLTGKQHPVFCNYAHWYVTMSRLEMFV